MTGPPTPPRIGSGWPAKKNFGDSLYEEFKQTEYAPPPLLKRTVASGRIGRKANRGIYEYGEKRAAARA